MQLTSDNAKLFVELAGGRRYFPTMREVRMALKEAGQGTYKVYQVCGPKHRRAPGRVRVIREFTVNANRVVARVAHANPFTRIGHACDRPYRRLVNS